MNSRFKLIKKYPGSPKKLGLTIFKNGPFWQSNSVTQNVEHFHKSENEFSPLDYPEFWEEIIEYPLSYKDLVSNESYTFEKSGHLYTFNLDEGVWYNHGFDRLYGFRLTKISNHKFRLATEKEIEMLFPKNKNYPVGTKVVDTNEETKGYIYEKQADGLWKINNMDCYTISESSIGKGRRFELVEETLCVPIGTKFQDRNGKIIYTIDSVEKDVVKITWNKNCYTHIFVSKCNEKFNNEKWVIYKDYEILSFINKEKEIFYKRSHGDFGKDGSVYLFTEKELIDYGYEIYSVKRICDDITFAIGNIIKGISGIGCVINEIKLSSDKNQIFFNPKSGNINLENAIKFVLETDDNKNIYMGDFYWTVTKSNLNLYKRTAGQENKTNDYNYYAHKENAEHYILMNKSVLSMQDVINIVTLEEWQKINLKHFTESKLNS
jgi:hypothetical protein